MNGTFDPLQLSRIEDAGINASAPREQLWVDGWLVRFSAGKAKRARCVQAVAAGRLTVEARVARCFEVFERARLRPYFRLTPFSQPQGLDEQLAAMGMERVDDTRVMVSPMPVRTAGDASAGAADLEWRAADALSFTDAIGALRGSTLAECRAHADRLGAAPVPHHALLVVDAQGAVVAGGQVAIESDLAGLYDVFTAESARRLGLARALCSRLLAYAERLGARTAYLQVDAGNAPARRLYAQMGFVDAYAYHYRTPPAA